MDSCHKFRQSERYASYETSGNTRGMYHAFLYTVVTCYEPEWCGETETRGFSCYGDLFLRVIHDIVKTSLLSSMKQNNKDFLLYAIDLLVNLNMLPLFLKAILNAF